MTQSQSECKAFIWSLCCTFTYVFPSVSIRLAAGAGINPWIQNTAPNTWACNLDSHLNWWIQAASSVTFTN